MSFLKKDARVRPSSAVVHLVLFSVQVIRKIGPELPFLLSSHRQPRRRPRLSSTDKFPESRA